MKYINIWLFNIIAIICICVYYSTRPLPNDPLAQQLREVEAYNLQEELIKQYYSDDKNRREVWDTSRVEIGH